MRKRWVLMLSKILCGVLSAGLIGSLCACGGKEEVSFKEQAKVGVSYLFDTNYLYHMLSVAKCGYDNDYSKTTICTSFNLLGYEARERYNIDLIHFFMYFSAL